MKTRFHKLLCLALCLLMTVAALSGLSLVASADSNYPVITLDEIGVCLLGKSHSITGTVTSATNLTKVKGQILSGSTVKKTVEITPNAKTVNLKNTDINNKIKFAELALGNYELRITATNSAGTVSRSVYFTIDMVIIGNAYSNRDGKSGDGDGKEVLTQNWYIKSSSEPWKYVFRANDPAVAERIAVAMEQACANDKIGYSNNSDRTSCYTQAKKVNFDLSKITTKCDADCSALVAVCVNAAGINISSGMTTASAYSTLTATNQFTVYTSADYTQHVMYLKRGDIIVRPKTSTKNGHAMVALTNGCKAETTAPSAKPTITLDEIGTVVCGNSHPVVGTVSSSTILTSVKGEILNGSTVVQTCTVTPNATSLILRNSAINTNLKFGTLAAGSYTLKITAVNSVGTTTKSVSFTVTSPEALTITVDAIGNVSYGSSHAIIGTVSSGSKLTSVKGEFLSGTTVKQSVTVTPNAKTLDLRSSNINKNLKFGSLAKGTYTLKITATDAAGTTKTYSLTFKIV